MIVSCECALVHEECTYACEIVDMLLCGFVRVSMCEREVDVFACGFSVAVIASCAPVRPRERRKDEDR